MLKNLVAAGALAVVAASPVSAAEVRFYGAFVVTEQAGTCPNGDQVGQRFFARFRPRNLGDNPPHSDLNLFEISFAQGFRLFDGAFGGSFKQVQATFIGGGSGLNEDNPVRVKFLTQEPSPIKANTPFVNITGQIKGYDFQPNCTVTFSLALTKQV